MNPDTSLVTAPVTGPLAAPVTATEYDNLMVNMAYRTDDNREVTVVFEGNEDDFDAELRPFRHAEHGVRVAFTYGEVYGWYDRTLSPRGWTKTPVAVQFKDETDLDGEPAGPMRLLFEGEQDAAQRPRPYNPNRRRARWVPRSHAEQVAASLGLPLTER